MIKPIKESYKALLTWRNLGLLGLCVLIAAMIGPFGTFESQSFLRRLIYWGLVGISSVLIGHGCHEIARHLVPRHRPILTDLLMSALMTVIFTPLLWALTNGVLIHPTENGPVLARLSYHVATITIAICVARRILPGFETVGYFGTSVQEPTAPPRLTRRLSPEFQGPILRLAVRDHFVDVVSAAGIETIRSRFADAIDEMDTVVGHYTHRSHWVARDAIVGSEWKKEKIFLLLTNGDLVPVSRKYRPELEEAGLL
ncbi:LytTR family DNA-binding domain-containing protein [Sedimentitalea nanhaiensis]|uniref:Transcriptional regulator, LytTR family n=1 Tax=Sedimentitalea nanhaiensis TaxID=999627 RepID=A0A1I7AX94_9RHOB|nr:LytTR family DNA-binding domain-containing protein [Sedimentitalea nanhaiensis]SFT79509.1 transcriptional regulator, LytTR family [Sedimentitalea nanhaiensis]